MKLKVVLMLVGVLVTFAVLAAPAFALQEITPEYCRSISYDSEACSSLAGTETGTLTTNTDTGLASGDVYGAVGAGQTDPTGGDPAASLNRSSLPNTGLTIMAPLAVLALSGAGAAALRRRRG